MSANEIKNKKRKHGSQNSMILKHLQDGLGLTPKLAYELFNTMNLAQRIAQLRKDGHDIQDKWMKSESGARFKQYWMPF